MKTSAYLLATGAFAAALAATPAGAATALEGRLFQLPLSTVDNFGPFGVPKHDAWSCVPQAPGCGPRDLTVNNASQAFNEGIVADTVQTSASISAHWDSADGGKVLINDHGWTITAPDPSVQLLSTKLSTGPGGEPDWSYAFTATGSSALDLSFDLLATGDTTGIGAWDLEFSKDGGPMEITHLIAGLAPGIDGIGAFSHGLDAGHDYRVSLRNLEGRIINVDTAGPDRIVLERGEFDWSISAVPEPSTWALSILGFGLTGWALRRRSGARVALA